MPALWYHRVSQKGLTVAVNYWHDMQFDHKYVYYRFLQGLASKYQHNKRFLLSFTGGASEVDTPSWSTAAVAVGGEGADEKNEGDGR